MGFLLGFFMGVLAAIGGFAFLAYWLCSRSNNLAVATFINGIAKALAHRPKSSAPSSPGGGSDSAPSNGERTWE